MKKTMKNTHGTLLRNSGLWAMAAAVVIAWQETPQDPKRLHVVEVRDAKGQVRCRVGQLDKAGAVFGLQLLDRTGRVRWEARSEEDLVEVGLGNPAVEATMWRVRSDATGVTQALGDESGTLLYLGVGTDGDVVLGGQTGPRKGIFALGARSGEAGGVALQLSKSPGEGGRINLKALKEAAFVELSGADGRRIRAESNAKDGDRMLLGRPADGIYLQASEPANLIELRRKVPRAALQVGGGGAGLVVTTPNGKPAVKIGVDASGAVKQSIDK